jgi:hypothetical protein
MIDDHDCTCLPLLDEIAVPCVTLFMKGLEELDICPIADLVILSQIVYSIIVCHEARMNPGQFIDLALMDKAMINLDNLVDLVKRHHQHMMGKYIDHQPHTRHQ